VAKKGNGESTSGKQTLYHIHIPSSLLCSSHLLRESSERMAKSERHTQKNYVYSAITQRKKSTRNRNLSRHSYNAAWDEIAYIYGISTSIALLYIVPLLLEFFLETCTLLHVYCIRKKKAASPQGRHISGAGAWELYCVGEINVLRMFYQAFTAKYYHRQRLLHCNTLHPLYPPLCGIIIVVTMQSKNITHTGHIFLEL